MAECVKWVANDTNNVETILAVGSQGGSCDSAQTCINLVVGDASQRLEGIKQREADEDDTTRPVVGGMVCAICKGGY